MTSLHALITALVRLLGLFYAIRAFDEVFASLFWMFTMPKLESPGVSYNPLFLTGASILIYGGICIGLFFLAPRLARLMIGVEEKNEAVEVPWHETLILLAGALVSGWAFVRITDTTYTILQSAATNAGEYQIDTPMLVYLFMSALLLAAGLLLIAKFHRISRWMDERRQGKHVS